MSSDKKIVAIEHTLTKNIMEGEEAFAFLNISLTALSDSPTNLLSSCDRTNRSAHGNDNVD